MGGAWKGGRILTVPLAGPRPLPLQVPQLYLLAVDACRLLGLATTPCLFVRNSQEAAIYYLQVPAALAAAFHGQNGSLAPTAAACAGAGGQQQPGGRPGSREAAAAAAEAGEWSCVLVLSSALLDLLEPVELQVTGLVCLSTSSLAFEWACVPGGLMGEGRGCCRVGNSLAFGHCRQ